MYLVDFTDFIYYNYNVINDREVSKMTLVEALSVFNLQLSDMRKIDRVLAKQVLESEQKTLTSTKCLSVKEKSMRNINALHLIKNENRWYLE